MPFDHNTWFSAKNYLHSAQAILIFFSWILTIVVFSRSGPYDSRTGWFFALCWLSLPLHLYIVMVPMFPRSRRFANLYAFAALNCLAVVLWLSAWAAVASYVASGKAVGKLLYGTNSASCDHFAFGSPGKCKVSEVTVFLGVIIMFLFAATSYLAIMAVIQFNRNGTMPTGKNSNDFAVHSEEAFSTTIRQDDFDEEEHLDARQGGRTGYQPRGHSAEDEYALLHQADQEDISQAHPVQTHGPLNVGPTSPRLHDYDTSYGGAHEGSYGHSPIQMPMPMHSPTYDTPPPPAYHV